MLSLYAQKLLAWFGIYKISSADYKAHLAKHPKAQQRGLFVDALDELYTNGY